MNEQDATRFVENEQLGIAKNGSSYSNPLSLTSRQGDTTVTNGSVETITQLVEERREPSLLTGSQQFVLRRRGLPHQKIVADRSGEQEDILPDHPDIT